MSMTSDVPPTAQRLTLRSGLRITIGVAVGFAMLGGFTMFLTHCANPDRQWQRQIEKAQAERARIEAERGHR